MAINYGKGKNDLDYDLEKLGDLGNQWTHFIVYISIYLGTSSKTEGPEYHNQEFGSDYTDIDSGL